jgi:hypothetical protein
MLCKGHRDEIIDDKTSIFHFFGAKRRRLAKRAALSGALRARKPSFSSCFVRFSIYYYVRLTVNKFIYALFRIKPVAAAACKTRKSVVFIV